MNPTQGTRITTAGDGCATTCVNERQVERTRLKQPSAQAFTRLAELFRALGDPTRLQLVSALAQGELCVCDLSRLVGVSESAVSHSLRTLRQLHLVRFRREGKIAYYALEKSPTSRTVLRNLRALQR